MKKIIAALCSLVLASALLTACTAGGSDGRPRIALLMSHMTNSFTTTLASAARARGEELGLSVTVFDAKQDVSNQISQVESVVSQGYDGILVEPVSKEGVTAGLKAANEAGIPTITLAQQASQQERASAFVGGNDTAAGRLEMEKAIEAMGGAGTVAILYGPMGSDGQLLRKDGYDQALADHPGVSVVFEQTANWDTAEALTVTENWLSTGQRIDAVVSQNDSMGIGAQKAIDNAGMNGTVAVYGVDATDDGLNSIRTGAMDGTVSQDTAGMGAIAVDTMKTLLDGGSVEAINYTEATWVTRDNVDTFASE